MLVVVVPVFMATPLVDSAVTEGVDRAEKGSAFRLKMALQALAVVVAALVLVLMVAQKVVTVDLEL
jgi:hypothetical protein